MIEKQKLLPGDLADWPRRALEHLEARRHRIDEAGMYSGDAAHEIAIEATRDWWAITGEARKVAA